MYRDIFSILIEILFSVFIIVFGYYIWDGFDQSDYEIAKYYDNIKEVQLIYESNIDNGYNGNNIVLSIHNISDKKNNKDIIFKLKKDNEINYININATTYNLEDLYLNDDDFYNYYLIEKAEFNGYETKVYFIDLQDKVYDYEFITEL